MDFSMVATGSQPTESPNSGEDEFTVLFPDDDAESSITKPLNSGLRPGRNIKKYQITVKHQPLGKL